MDNKSFTTMAVASLFEEGMKYHFVIPSFQRGYRWEKKQVLDMLNDLKQFADDDSRQNDSYYLQPLVVKACNGDNTWEVIDGQQRLTTMLLILKRLIVFHLSEFEKHKYIGRIYDITYTNRPQLDFDSPNPADNIDSYYLSEAKLVIDKWFDNNWEFGLDTIKSILLTKGCKKQAKFIWYPIEEQYREVDSINIFNRLNNGKIGLTSSELIKALFLLESRTDDDIDDKTLAIEWDHFERRLQDDSFWFFISDNKKGYQTRIDLLFDFVTEKNDGEDSDYSYRKFQNLFDYCRKSGNVDNLKLDVLWEKNNVSSMEEAWRFIKKVFDRLLSWYEDNMFYHYVGFLVAEGETPLAIYTTLEKDKEKCNHEWTLYDTEKSFFKLIREKFKEKNKYLSLEDITALEYNSLTLVRRALLLFNIETCRRSGYMRFAFDRYKKENWDVEHINSQNDSSLQSFEERMDWMERIKGLLMDEDREDARQLLERAVSLMQKFNERKQVDKQDYLDFFNKVNRFFTPDYDTFNKNCIGNLTLLDSSTNREYKDAPFPYKRQCIIRKDRKGDTFIPVCTRNLFLKYYTDHEKDFTQFNMMRWTKKDVEKYMEHIIIMIKEIFIISSEEKGNNNE